MKAKYAFWATGSSWLRLGFLALACAALLAGAGVGQDRKLQGKWFDADYYPLHVGNQWHYRATSADSAAQSVVMTVEGHEDFEYKSPEDKKDTLIVRSLLRVRSGANREHTEHVAVLGDGVYRFTSAKKDITPPLRFFKLPAQKGQSWQTKSLSENVALQGTFTCDDAVVKVPLGQYPAKYVYCSDFQLGAEKMSLEYWFVQDIGMVKQRVRVGTFEVILELEKFIRTKQI